MNYFKKQIAILLSAMLVTGIAYITTFKNNNSVRISTGFSDKENSHETVNELESINKIPDLEDKEKIISSEPDNNSKTPVSDEQEKNVSDLPEIKNELNNSQTAEQDPNSKTETVIDKNQNYSPQNLSDNEISGYEHKVIYLVNEIRVKNGLNPLNSNDRLSFVAAKKSEDMYNNKYFSHTSPTYGSPFDMLKSFGIKYRTAGENIAIGYKTPESVVEGWMNSEGHRANILNPDFKEIGVGYFKNGNYWTQMFIG